MWVRREELGGFVRWGVESVEKGARGRWWVGWAQVKARAHKCV